MAGLAEAALEEVQRRAKGREATATKHGEASRSTGKATHRLPCVKDAVDAAHASGEQPALRSIAEMSRFQPVLDCSASALSSLRMDANFEAAV